VPGITKRFFDILSQWLHTKLNSLFSGNDVSSIANRTNLDIHEIIYRKLTLCVCNKSGRQCENEIKLHLWCMSRVDLVFVSCEKINPFPNTLRIDTTIAFCIIHDESVCICMVYVVSSSLVRCDHSVTHQKARWVYGVCDFSSIDTNTATIFRLSTQQMPCSIQDWILRACMVMFDEEQPVKQCVLWIEINSPPKGLGHLQGGKLTWCWRHLWHLRTEYGEH